MAASHRLKGRPRYLSIILAQCQRNRSLQSLSNFYINSASHRHPCRLACLEFSSANENPCVKILDVEGLSQMLQNPHENNEDQLGRLLVVEDLTADVIELLGSSLEIDPLFFALHLHATRSEKTVEQPDVRLLPSKARHLGILSTIYHRPLTFAGNPIPAKLCCDANVRRKVGNFPGAKGTLVGLTQRSFSTLMRVKEGGAWFGLALVDPPVRNTFFIDERGKQRAQTPIILRCELFQGGYDDFLPTGSYRIDDADGPPRSSLFDALIYYWTKHPPPVFKPQVPNLLSLSYYPLKIIVAEWMSFANLMHYAVENLEYSVEDFSISISELQGIEANLRDLQSWRRRSTDSLYKMRHLAREVESLGFDSNFAETWESLLDDIENVVYRIDIYAQRFDAMIPILTSFVQIAESRRSFAETKSITRMTYLALVFVPLTFVSSLFSMSADLGPGKKDFWIYFTVAIPLMVVVFWVARH